MGQAFGGGGLDEHEDEGCVLLDKIIRLEQMRADRGVGVDTHLRSL